MLLRTLALAKGWERAYIEIEVLANNVVAGILNMCDAIDLITNLRMIGYRELCGNFASADDEMV